METLSFDPARPMDIVLLGRIAIDLNPLDYYKPLDRSETFARYLGGSPANIAVGMARLGHAVGFFGRVSDDRFGDFARNALVAEGIDASRVRRCEKGESLGLTFTEILAEGESNILMYRTGAADLALRPEDIDAAYIRDARMLLISGTALSASPSREAALKAIALAKQCATPVVFDADFRPYSWESDDAVSVYTAIAAGQSDVIMGSREEFDRMERLIGSFDDDMSARYWLAQGAKLVVIKHGKEGSAAFVQGVRHQVRPFAVAALKGFGGGDGYASALLHGLLRGWALNQALTYASASASMLVASHACSRDMPTEAQIAAFIDQYPAKTREAIVQSQIWEG